MNIDKSDLFNILANIQQLITLCDQKTGILLAIYSITLPLFINNNYVVDKLSNLIDNIQLNIYSILFVMIFLSLVGSLYYIIQVFKARTDNKINNSKIYFEDISKSDYESFKNDIQNMNSNELEDDLIGQLYVNSIICHEKYVHFKKALNCFVIFLVLYILLYILLFMGV